jgi:AcrR family transcriptional regulator
MSRAEPRAKRSYRQNDASVIHHHLWPPTKQAVYEAALDLFYEKGFEATSVGEICTRAGLTKGALYHYFPSKDDLLWACMVHALERTVPGVREIAEKQPNSVEFLRQFVAFNAQSMEHNHREISVFLTQWRQRSENLPAELVANRAEYESIVFDQIERGIANGELRDLGSPRIIAFALHGLLTHPQLWWGPEPTEEVQEAVTAIVINALCTEEVASAAVAGAPTKRRVAARRTKANSGPLKRAAGG